MTEGHHDQRVANSRALTKKLEAAGWGLFFTWIGIALLAEGDIAVRHGKAQRIRRGEAACATRRSRVDLIASLLENRRDSNPGSSPRGRGLNPRIGRSAGRAGALGR
jgi:hypothetical protein